MRSPQRRKPTIGFDVDTGVGIHTYIRGAWLHITRRGGVAAKNLSAQSLCTVGYCTSLLSAPLTTNRFFTTDQHFITVTKLVFQPIPSKKQFTQIFLQDYSPNEHHEVCDYFLVKSFPLDFRIKFRLKFRTKTRVTSAISLA